MQYNYHRSPRMKKDKKKFNLFFVGTILMIVFLLVGATLFMSKMGSTTQALVGTEARSHVEATRYDWGNIDIDGGTVRKSFLIENVGSAPLKLVDVRTSCMCTSAQLIGKTRSSKKFGMHDRNSTPFDISPGETAELLIEFDPKFHGPNGIGPISRTVTMRTNDINHPTLSFQLLAEVIKE